MTGWTFSEMKAYNNKEGYGGIYFVITAHSDNCDNRSVRIYLDDIAALAVHRSIGLFVAEIKARQETRTRDFELRLERESKSPRGLGE